ncbi:MAG: hypothetical protein M1814_005559 [Vezdaea aestivalis]|nr:MAG: hypothetical protein M1814_005559 [Vezdaea aestivalis]
MSPAVERSQRPPKIEMPVSQARDTPPISAIFVIYFDLRAGYTLGWRRSLPGVELEGVVEYKSLPSGLHHVDEDLVYFVHDGYAGLSAFINEKSDEAERNATMLAVGILVPLSFGRLGRSWKHADSLKELVRDLLPDIKNTKAVEEYWEANRAPEDDDSHADSPIDSPSSLRFKPIRDNQNGSNNTSRKRAASDAGTTIIPGHHLSPHHPALSLPKFFDCFGPLIFPVYRAALLRKRILLITQTPVELACNYVYNISILSNIPAAINELLSPISPGPRLRPLFALGIHDIPYLASDAKAMDAEQPDQNSNDSEDQLGTGWVACTTDEILASKSDLFDVVIRLPAPFTENAVSKAWPDIKDSQGASIKATQRDWRRYNIVRQALSKLEPSQEPDSPDNEADSVYQKLLAPSSTSRDSKDSQERDESKILEPPSWSALAYSSFMWWASAGEARQDIVEEEERDLTLFEEPYDPQHPVSSRPRSRSSLSAPLAAKDIAEPELALIAYFHRLTTLTLSIITNIMDSTDDEDENGGEPAVFVSSDDMTRMGLDLWSTSDRRFVEELLGVYFDRRAEVPGGTIECCGIQVTGG